ncbi:MULTISPECIES: nuclear transport factor 2 family protein [Bosea]|uniref:YybH family protein n=1 Tax=Bosea TaxID=85413 RepID=UPI00214F8638|nr:MULTISPECIES: nuclear transport factor 2 family protein [Bosea]MCR4520485.1 nuclear transport factor 2 family protein [Bosea sp. 47.2.35]MDR6827838.1 ketosteroid isomerase-like protein [Bosea robiniae]MDR6894468.1 ketosteroid isomerase-like protein [Bosea sp. BE109]MDR7137944.1 ketosteroid isomerase-like protein [Bosea sp. BE168]MDR7174643.1 ketosteroid isomerase-like protein [Bosea sp. BE271]
MTGTGAASADCFPAALAALRSALADVANGDVRAIKELYSHSHEATSFYGWGGYEKGWEAVSRRWDWAAEQFKGGTVSHENITTVLGDPIALVTDIETFEVAMTPGAPPARWTNRVTHVFRFEEGGWRLLHRHANRLEGRYDPANRLQAAGAAPRD